MHRSYTACMKSSSRGRGAGVEIFAMARSSHPHPHPHPHPAALSITNECEEEREGLQIRVHLASDVLRFGKMRASCSSFPMAKILE